MLELVLFGIILIERYVNKLRDKTSLVLQQNVSTWRRFQKIFLIIIPVTVVKINKMVDSRFPG